MSAPPRLILASRSPRRIELLRASGYSFTVDPADLDETIDRDATPAENAVRLARDKARAVAGRIRVGVILASDTLVALGDEVIGKPRDDRHAREILTRLSGTRHRVISAVAVRDGASGTEASGHDETWLRMAVMNPADIDRYVASGAAADKAGAYAYQEGGDRFLKIETGEVDTVVGLPLGLTRALLERFGVRPSEGG